MRPNFSKIQKELTKLRASNNKIQRCTVPKKYREDYNCYGFVANMFGWDKIVIWKSGRVMEELLSTKTREIDKDNLKEGDIVVFKYPGGGIQHTAIVTDPENGTILHKPGSCNLEISTIDSTISKDNYGPNITYMEVI